MPHFLYHIGIVWAFASLLIVPTLARALEKSGLRNRDLRKENEELRKENKEVKVRNMLLKELNKRNATSNN